MCWETKHVTRLTLLRYLFQGSGTEPAISLRRACAVYMNLHGSVYSNNCNQSTDFFPVTKLWGNKCRGSTFFPGIIILSLSKCIQVSAILFPEAGFNYVLPIFLKKKENMQQSHFWVYIWENSKQDLKEILALPSSFRNYSH